MAVAPVRAEQQLRDPITVKITQQPAGRLVVVVHGQKIVAEVGLHLARAGAPQAADLGEQRVVGSVAGRDMNDILSGTYKGNTYRIKVECYPNTPAIKVQLLPVDAGERITMTQNLGQPLPRYQAFLCDGMLEVDSTAFMDYMEENDLGYIVDYKRYDADVFTGVNRRTAAVFQFHSAALRRLNKVGCQRYEGDYTRLKQKHAERRARRMAG